MFTLHKFNLLSLAVTSTVFFLMLNYLPEKPPLKSEVVQTTSAILIEKPVENNFLNQEKIIVNIPQQDKVNPLEKTVFQSHKIEQYPLDISQNTNEYIDPDDNQWSIEFNQDKFFQGTEEYIDPDTVF